MIDAIERQNNIREFIELTTRLFKLLKDLSLIKYAKFNPINRIYNKESSWIAKESQNLLIKQLSFLKTKRL